MEDYTTVKFDFCDTPGYHFFAVLDGHVDYRVAEYCSKNLPEFLETKLGELIKSDASAEKISSAIEQAYLEFDQKIRASGLRSGSTCSSVLLTPKNFIFANVGDSRTLLVDESSELKFATEDHKPMDAEERNRIYETGGFVRYNRVNGNLALSRAFGDFDLKPNFEGSWPSRSFYDTFQPVIASPACTIISRGDTDSLLVLGSDGVFDVLSSSETAKYVHHEASIFGKNKEVAWKLVDTSFSRGSSDNITALVVFLNDTEYKSQKFIERHAKMTELIKSTIENIFASTKTPTTTNEAVQIWRQILSKLESDPTLQQLLPLGAGLSSQLSLIRGIFSARLNLK